MINLSYLENWSKRGWCWFLYKFSFPFHSFPLLSLNNSVTLVNFFVLLIIIVVISDEDELRLYLFCGIVIHRWTFDFGDDKNQWLAKQAENVAVNGIGFLSLKCWWCWLSHSRDDIIDLLICVSVSVSVSEWFENHKFEIDMAWNGSKKKWSRHRLICWLIEKKKFQIQ